MKLTELAIVTAALTWPISVAAQDAGDAEGGLRLGVTAEKAIGAPAAGADPAATAPFAGTDSKLAEPGEVALPEPELAEPIPVALAEKPMPTEPAAKEPVAEAKDTETAALPDSGADARIDPEYELATLTVLPERAAEPAPPPEIELGADPTQMPAVRIVALDGVVATTEAAPQIVSDTGGAGEELDVDAVRDLAAITRPDVPELAETAISTTDLVTRHDGQAELGDPATTDDVHLARAAGEVEEARELTGLIQHRATAATDAMLEAAIGDPIAPDTTFATVTEEVMTAEETLVLAALADDPTREFEEKSMIDPNAVACLEGLGEPDAGVPASAALAAGARTALAAAAEACEAAAAGPNPAPQVLYHAAEVALARRETERAFALFTRAADAGLGAALTKLGDFHLFGAAPTGRDVDKAVAQFEASSAQGDAAGMTSLAMMYRAAIGVPQDPVRMMDLLTGAADSGYHFAQYRLAQTYLTGEGIPGGADPALGIPDPAQAQRWFTAAADAGNIEAALELAGLYADPASGLPDNPAEQARLTKMAADTGLPAAIATMGALHEMGRGVEYSAELAAEYYIRAVETGEVALENLRPGAPPLWDRPTAVAFQTALAARGVYDGVIDGLVGGGTLAAAQTLAAGN